MVSAVSQKIWNPPVMRMRKEEEAVKGSLLVSPSCRFPLLTSIFYMAKDVQTSMVWCPIIFTNLNDRLSDTSRSDMVYDFDIMMQKKREESYRRRKRKNIDIINDSDDVIAEMINQMKQAAEV